MKYLRITFFIILLVSLTNCIPIKTAPEVNGHSIIQGKKINKSLGDSNYFVFRNHLYDNDLTAYVEFKLNAEDNSFLQNIQVNLNGVDFLMTFKTIESTDKTLNFIAPIINRSLNNSLKTDYDENIRIDERENYFVVVYVESDTEADSLKEGSIHRSVVENYLIKFINEYQRIGSKKELDFIIGNN